MQGEVKMKNLRMIDLVPLSPYSEQFDEFQEYSEEQQLRYTHLAKAHRTERMLKRK